MKKRKSAPAAKLFPEEHLAALVRKEQSHREDLERSIENAFEFFESEGLPTMADIEVEAPHYLGLFGAQEMQQEVRNIVADLRDWHTAVNNLLEARGLGLKAWKAANKRKAA
jgi:hypothetical protein